MLNDIIVVSDIDDTIKWSHILAFPEVVADALNYNLAFKGMPELYTFLANAGARIEYVTGAPDLLIGKLQMDLIPQKVISANRFPQGTISLHQPGESTEDFKVTKITDLMNKNPSFDFILIGDNGEKDIETYTRVRQNPEIGSRVRQVFIHKIYNGGSSLEPMADQHPYVTSAELAAMLYGFELLNANDLAEIVKIVNAGMKNTGADRNLTLPLAAQLVPAQVDAMYGLLPTTIDPPTHDLLDEIHNLISDQANRGTRSF